MSKFLLAAAALGLSLSGAYAECAGHRTVQASEPEKTVVASNETGSAAMSDPAVAEAARPAEAVAQPAK